MSYLLRSTPSSRQRSIGREHHIAAARHVVAPELSAIDLRLPVEGILDDDGILLEGNNHLLLADEQMGTVVVKQVDGRMFRTVILRHQHIRTYLIISAQLELELAGHIAVALLFAQHHHVPCLWSRRRCHHALQHLAAGRLLPLAEVGDVRLAPCQRIFHVGNERVAIYGHVLLEFIKRALLPESRQRHNGQ